MSHQEDIWRCPKCGECLDISSFGFYTEVVCPTCAHRAYVHSQIANFRLEGILGTGGMSVVLSAKDLILNRKLAIKVLNDTYRDSPERIARFQNECALMARVRHENVVSVYSAGQVRGQFYIAMELIHGKNLESVVLEGKPMPAAKALEVTREIALGLQAAHKAGILHRDMKPGNVIISDDGKAKVLDFGLSLGKQAEDTEEVIWATPYYVPPETLKREPEDARADIYALGMTLRFLLTGESKLPGNNESLADLVKAKRTLQPFSQLCPQASPALARLVDRMTAYKPSARPASYTTLLEELSDVLTIQREEDAEKAPARVFRRRLMYVGAGLLTLALGAGGGLLTTWLTLPPKEQDALEYMDYKDKGDYARMGIASRAIGARKWLEALPHLDALAKDSAEPALAATACLLQAYYAAVQGDGDENTDYLERFHKLLSKGGAVSPAAADTWAELQRVDASLQSSEYTVPEGFRPEFAGILYALKAKQAADENETEAAREACGKAREEFAKTQKLGKVRARHGKLADLLKGYESRLQIGEGEGPLQAARNALAAHDFETADARLAELQLRKDGLSEGQMAAVEALQEISQVGRGVVAVLQARCPGKYTPGMSANDMKGLAAGVDSATWKDEVYTLALLLNGEYKAAFDASPYREDPQSSRPFAILLQGWRKALLP